MKLFERINQKLVILRGAPSSGKSTIAYMLSKKISNSYKLSIDSLVSATISPSKVQIDEWKEARPLAHELAGVLIKYLLSKGKSVIIEEIFLGTDEIDMFVKLAEECNVKVFVFELKVSLDEALRREKIRPFASKGKPVKEAIGIIENNAYENAIGIDTTKLSTDQIVNIILQKIEK